MSSTWKRRGPSGLVFDGGERALEALADCFAKLTERARMALRLRFVQDASPSSHSRRTGRWRARGKELNAASQSAR